MRRTVLAVALLACLALAGPAQAVDFEVTRLDDPPPGQCLANDCSLREAVRAANLATTDDIVRLPAGSHLLTIPGDDQAAATGDLDVTDNLAIGGQGPSSTAIDANGIDRAFEVLGSGTNFTLVGVTVTGGRVTGDPPAGAGAGVRAEPGTGLLDLTDDVFTDNAVQPAANSSATGGVVRHEGAALRVARSAFEDNRANGGATASGGAISVSAAGAETTITGTRFDENLAAGANGSGFGGAVMLTGSGGETTMDDVAFTGNTASGTSGNGAFGGAVRVQGTNATVAVTRGRFTGNRAGGAATGIGNGGAVDIQATGIAATLGQSTFSGNVAGGGDVAGTGGAVRVTGSPSSLTSSDNAYTLNSAGGGGANGTGDGGAVAVGGTDGLVALTRDTVASNRAGGGGAMSTGGGISVFAPDRTVTIVATSIDSNRAGGAGGTALGGGARIGGAGNAVSIRRSSLTRNVAGSGGGQGFGGGLYMNGGGGSWTLENSTIAHNALPAGGGVATIGGGAYLDGASAASLLNMTIARNRINPAAVAVGAGLARANGTATVRNSIVSGNTPGNCAPGGIVSAGRNIELGTSCGLTATTDRNADPRLDSLEENGGPTLTMAIFASSPAFDRGRNCPATDQRGVLRPVGPFCDIGAYEAGPRVLTRPASNVRFDRAQLNATVTPNFRRTTTRFEFGRTTSYGRSVAGPTLGPNAPATGFSRVARNLRPNTTYHYRAVASNFDRTTYGGDRTFRTPKDPFPGLQMDDYSAEPTNGRVDVTGRCPKVTAGACRGRLVLKEGETVIARAKFKNLKPGRMRAIWARLTAAGRERVAESDSVNTRVTATTRNALGTRRVTTARYSIVTLP